MMAIAVVVIMVALVDVAVVVVAVAVDDAGVVVGRRAGTRVGPRARATTYGG